MVDRILLRIIVLFSLLLCLIGANILQNLIHLSTISRAEYNLRFTIVFDGVYVAFAPSFDSEIVVILNLFYFYRTVIKQVHDDEIFNFVSHDRATEKMLEANYSQNIVRAIIPVAPH